MEKAGILRVTIMTGQTPKNANKTREVFLPPFYLLPTVTLESSLKIMVNHLLYFLYIVAFNLHVNDTKLAISCPVLCCPHWAFLRTTSCRSVLRRW